MSAHKIRLACRPFLIAVRGCTLVLRANAKKGFPDQSSTAVAGTLRPPAKKMAENKKRGGNFWHPFPLIITLALRGLEEPLFVLLCNFFSGGK